MPSRRSVIEQTTLQARADWWRYTVTQEKAIFDMLSESADRLILKINAVSRAGKIPPARLGYLLDNVQSEMRALRPKLAGQISRGMSRSVDMGMSQAYLVADKTAQKGFKVGIGSSYITDKGTVVRSNIGKERYADSAWAKINADAMNALIRFKPQALIFSNRVWNVTFATQRALFNEIQLAVLQGTSPATLSRTIRGFLSQPNKLFRRVRKDGKLVLSRSARAFTPGQGVYRSSFKNAMRLTRTELARAYHEGTIRYGLQKSFIDGFIWRTASGEPCPICSDLDGVYFPKEDVPGIPHPSCFCYLENHYTDQEVPASAEKDLKADTEADIFPAIP